MRRAAVLRVLAVAGPLAITTALWLLSKTRFEAGWQVAPWQAASQITSLWALALFPMDLLISARSRTVDKMYGGLDKFHHMHGTPAKVAFALVLAHPLHSDRQCIANNCHPTLILESNTFFYTHPPTLGNCAAGRVPDYRVFGNRADASHRYTTSRTVRDQMVAKGWLAEGDGPDTVLMCAPTGAFGEVSYDKSRTRVRLFYVWTPWREPRGRARRSHDAAGHSGDSPQPRELIPAANGPRHTVPPTPAYEFDQRIGDVNAFALVQQHFEQLQRVATRHGGAIIKSIGDAIMVAFVDPADAVAAAIDMRREIAASNLRQPNRALILKIGVHRGAAIAVTLNDRLACFEQTVNTAARVQNLADADEICISRDAYDADGVKETLASFAVESRDARLRGVEQSLQVFAVAAREAPRPIAGAGRTASRSKRAWCSGLAPGARRSARSKPAGRPPGAPGSASSTRQRAGCRRRASTATATSACSHPAHPCAPLLA